MTSLTPSYDVTSLDEMAAEYQASNECGDAEEPMYQSIRNGFVVGSDDIYKVCTHAYQC